MVVSGFCDGTAETLRVHYDEFENVFPNANRKYWNPAESWENKWKMPLRPSDNNWYYLGYNPKYAEKFPYSSTALSFATDGYHMIRMVRNVTMITAIVIPIGSKKNWKQYVVEAGCYYLAYTSGFNLAFDVIYK